MNALKEPPALSPSADRRSGRRAVYLGQGTSVLIHLAVLVVGGVFWMGWEGSKKGEPEESSLESSVELEFAVQPPPVAKEPVRQPEENDDPLDPFEVAMAPYPSPGPEPGPESVEPPKITPVAVVPVVPSISETVAVEKKESKEPGAGRMEKKPVSNEKTPGRATADGTKTTAASAGSGSSATGDGSGVSVLAYSRPTYLSTPEPFYPPEARKNGQVGRVLLEVKISKKGNVTSLRLKQSCGYLLLDQAALKAVKDWKFNPGRVAGEPVESSADVPVRFRLN